MISRRRILSRSRDELENIEEEDVWYQRDRLFKDHIEEVLQKWEQIDDEIWAKIICMERNRRVAKAYARAPELEINGGAEPFDGFKIGLNAFDNPMRDDKTHDTKKRIGTGARITMDTSGNIIIKRISKNAIFVNGAQSGECSAISKEVIDARGLLEFDKPVKLFDMERFRANVIREMKRAYPDRRALEAQCISCIAFVRDSSDLLQVPVWVMVINIVALDMLKSKLPPHYAVPAATKRQSAPNLMSIFDSSPACSPRGSKDDLLEDPYTALAGGAASSSSAGSSGHGQPTMIAGSAAAAAGIAGASTGVHAVTSIGGLGVAGSGSRAGGGGNSGHGKQREREQRPPKLPPRDRRPRVPRPDYEDTYSGGPSGTSSTAPNHLHQQTLQQQHYQQLHQQQHTRSHHPPQQQQQHEMYSHQRQLQQQQAATLGGLYSAGRAGGLQQANARKISSSSPGIYDDPYYCGLKARVPNFGQRDPLAANRRDRLHRDAIYAYASSNHSSTYLNSLYSGSTGGPRSAHTSASHAHGGSSGIYQSTEHDYSKIYGVLPMRQNSTAQSSSSGGSSAGATPTYAHTREVYVGEWE